MPHKECISVYLNPEVKPINNHLYQITEMYYYNSDTLCYENSNYRICNESHTINDINGYPVKFSWKGKTSKVNLHELNTNNQGFIYTDYNYNIGRWYINGKNLHNYYDMNKKSNTIIISFGFILLVLIVLYITFNKNY